ncbi:MAG: hypothetical protein ACR2P5_00715 [Gammaproteobacteria bacterium]
MFYALYEFLRNDIYAPVHDFFAFSGWLAVPFAVMGTLVFIYGCVSLAFASAACVFSPGGDEDAGGDGEGGLDGGGGGE